MVSREVHAEQQNATMNKENVPKTMTKRAHEDEQHAKDDDGADNNVAHFMIKKSYRGDQKYGYLQIFVILGN